MGQPTRQLVIRADDLGMCHAVNEGTLKGIEAGIVTQTSVMTACPWFPEAAVLVRRTGIPAGIHLTLTCEWDFLRWRPMTDGASLSGGDGTFHRTIEDAQKNLSHAEAVKELLAQVRRAFAEGLAISYLDAHMGEAAPDAISEVSETFGLPLTVPGHRTSVAFASWSELSPRAGGSKKAWMLEYLRNLTPGLHLLVCHLAVPGPEIASLTGPDSIPYRWAEEYRKSDLEVVTDPEIRQAIQDLGIELTSVAAWQQSGRAQG